LEKNRVRNLDTPVLPLLRYVMTSSSNVGNVDTGASIENRQTLLSSNLKLEIK